MLPAVDVVRDGGGARAKGSYRSGAAINFIADEHRLTVLQPPYGPRVRQSAVSFPHARRKDFLGTHCLGDLFRGRCSPACGDRFRFRRFFPRASCRCSSARTEKGCETFWPGTPPSCRFKSSICRFAASSS